MAIEAQTGIYDLAAGAAVYNKTADAATDGQWALDIDVGDAGAPLGAAAGLLTWSITVAGQTVGGGAGIKAKDLNVTLAREPMVSLGNVANGAAVTVTLTSSVGADTSVRVVVTPRRLEVNANVVAVAGTPSVLQTDPVDANVTQISGDSGAADNLESAYDGTGYAGGTIKQDVNAVQVSGTTQTAGDLVTLIGGIGSGTGAALNFAPDDDSVDGAIVGAPVFDPLVPFRGTQLVGKTFLDVAADDGSYHQIDDGAAGDANEIDIVYQFSIGAGRNCAKVVFTGYMGTGTADTCVIKAYNFLTGAWDTRSTLIGQTGTADKVQDITLLSAHTGTGAHAGKVYLRFDSTATNQVLMTDSLIAQAQNLGQTVGYSDGSIWVDTINGSAGTTPYVNGTADNPVLTWADALTLSAAVGITSFHFLPNSSITLTASVANFRFIGIATIALANQSIQHATFRDCYTISGLSSGDDATFRDCGIGTATTDHAYFYDCRFKGVLTFVAAKDYYIIDGSDLTPSAGDAATFVFASDTTCMFRRWTGGIRLSNMLGGTDAGAVIIDGAGRIELTDTCVGGTVTIRGNFPPIIAGAGLHSEAEFTTHGGVITQTQRFGTDQTYVANMTQLGSSTQSATDLKDFADTGYNPSTHQADVNVAAIAGSTLAAQALAAASYAYKDDAVALVADGDTDLLRGTALLAAMVVARALTPGGNALSATNRATVLVPAGRYDLATGTTQGGNANTGLLLDTAFVDLAGITGNPDDVVITSQIARASRGTVQQPASDVRISGVTLDLNAATAGSYDITNAAYFPGASVPLTRMTACKIQVSGAGGYPMRVDVTYAGTFTDCTCTGTYGFGGDGTASGTFTNCVHIGDYGFAGSGIASGTFTNCTHTGSSGFAGDSESIAGTASGTFTDCKHVGTCGFAGGATGGTASGVFAGCIHVGDWGFAGGTNGGPASGTFTDCVCIGNYGFGGGLVNGGSAGGTFKNNLLIGASGFGGGATEGTAAGTFDGDIGIGASNWPTTPTGKFRACRRGAQGSVVLLDNVSQVVVDASTAATSVAAILADTSELQTDWANGGRLDTLLDDVPTTTEFEARTLVAANYFDPAADTVATVTTVTNMVAEAPSAATIAAAVWAYSTRTLTSFGTLVASIWSYVTRALTGGATGAGPAAATGVADIVYEVFRDDTRNLFANVSYNGVAITQASIASIVYSAYLVDPDDEDNDTVLAGHDGVAVTVASVVYDALQTDQDATGYNFRHRPSNGTHPLYTIRGRRYRVAYTFTMSDGVTFIVRFEVRCI